MTDTFALLSGERFTVVYRLACSEAEAWERAAAICREQTAELPLDLLPSDEIWDQIVGRIESLSPLPDGCFEAKISYAVEVAGTELPQLLNMVFGKVSLIPGVRVERLELSPGLLKPFKGPRFGRAGLRAYLEAPHRPLLAATLKPMGLPASELAQLAFQFALGGIDIIQDATTLADQRLAPFEERVERCTEAVARANQVTGGRSIYMPNVTATAYEVMERALLAREVGAGGLLICPGITGFDVMRLLAGNDDINLPIMAHPAFLGSFVANPVQGISPYALFGQIMRLAGADATSYPDWGDCSSFDRETCQSIAEGCGAAMGGLRTSFPAPEAEINRDRVPELYETYGREMIVVLGGSLYSRGPNLAENACYFREILA